MRSNVKASIACPKDVRSDPLAWTYNLDDPRPYFRALSSLQYRQPAVVANFVLSNASTIMAARKKNDLRIIDFASGYGAVASLLKLNISLDNLYSYYNKDIEGDVLRIDQLHFGKYEKCKAPLIVGGLDIADRAVRYAVECGFQDVGFTDDLTVSKMSDRLAKFTESVDIIVEAGAIYSVSRQCYQQLIDGAHGNKPWLLFGPRGDADTRPLWSWLQESGYKVELCKREPYRRLMDTQEREDVEKHLKRLGRELNDYVRNGWLINDLFLAKPTV